MMSKYPILITWGLQQMALRGDWFSPSGNYWEVVDNGLLGGELLYDPKTKKVYGLALKEIKDAGKDFIDQCENELLIKKASRKMTVEQAKTILKDNHDQ